MEYQERIADKWNGVRECEKDDVEEKWQMFKSIVVGCTKKVCGVKRVGGAMRKASEWWCEDVSVIVADKEACP